MPIYEYKCKSCDHRMDKLQRMNDDPLVDCPSCDKPELVKLVSAAGFRLTGTGWYETDFKNNGKPSSQSDSAKTGKTKSNDSPSQSDSAAPKKTESKSDKNT